MNSSKPIWTKKPKEVTDDEYTEFYKAIAKVSHCIIQVSSA